MATTRFKVFANLYKDSVTLMQLGAQLRARDGVEQASCLMATPANLAQLADAQLSIDAKFSPSDLLVVVRGAEAACAEALAAAEASLKAAAPSGSGERSEFKLPLTSLALGIAQTPNADLALISVPGDYAAAEARKALSLGLHVMLFSDNVSVADEHSIKTFARERGLLVMGPDCGTAIINGVPLGFANAVRRGSIGLVAASGTGLQEVTCRIHNLGSGVSQALGTGGRDLKEDVGGITMLQGIRMLSADPATRVIVLISKPPAPAVARLIEAAAADASAAGKRVVVHFLGAAPGELPAGLVAASSLRHAADLAVALAGDARAGSANADSTFAGDTRLPGGVMAPSAADLAAIEPVIAAMAPSQHVVRALFTGGTFCYEAQLVFSARGLPCSSNAPAHGVAQLAAHGAAARPSGHVFLDLGDDDYTRGRPHPMIDPSQRDALIRSEGAALDTAAILFDVVLGYGAHADPAAGLARALDDAQRAARAQGRTLALIGHVCGTDADPQDKARQVRQLQEVGALIVGSNVEASMLAAHIATQRTG